jgi:adenosylhomocysteinase
MTTLAERALRAEAEIGRINTFFPILPLLGNQWAARRPFEGRVVGVNLHLTTLTGALIRELTLGGGTFVVCAAAPETTDKGVVDLLRQQGIEVYTGGDLKDRHAQVLSHSPDVLVDVGFELSDALIARRPDLLPHLRGVIEISKSGVTKMRERKNLSFPVVNLNDGLLKNAVENRHGVGEALWQAVGVLTGMHLSGRRALVLGYGPVGRGLAAYARAAGMTVEVVDRDPMRRLLAHYDGFPVPSLDDAITRAGIIVTATGTGGALPVSALERARDGAVLVNAGHGGNEIDLDGIQRVSTRVDNIADHVVRYHLDKGPRITVLAHGHPLNIVTNSGSPEPVLLHFAVLGFALEWLVGNASPPTGEVVVSREIETKAAELALAALEATGS